MPNVNLTGDEHQWARGAAERQAVNTTVQGSAAEGLKRAVIEIDRRIQSAYGMLYFYRKTKLYF